MLKKKFWKKNFEKSFKNKNLRKILKKKLKKKKFEKKIKGIKFWKNLEKFDKIAPCPWRQAVSSSNSCDVARNF